MADTSFPHRDIPGNYPIPAHVASHLALCSQESTEVPEANVKADKRKGGMTNSKTKGI